MSNTVNKRINLGLIIPLLVIGFAFILGGVSIENEQVTPAPDETTKTDTAEEESQQPPTEEEDDESDKEEETDKKDQPKTDTEEGTEPDQPEEDMPIMAEDDLVVAEPISVDKKPAPAKKFNLQLTPSFTNILVETGLPASASYYISSEKPACSSRDEVYWIKVSKNSIDNLSDKDWVCVRARTSSKTPYQFRLIQVDLTKPDIYLQPQLDSVFVSTQPKNVANTDYFRSSRRPSCDGKDRVNWKKLIGEEIKNTKHDWWICIRSQIKDKSVFGYKAHKVNLEVKPIIYLDQKGFGVSVDFDLKPVYNPSWFKSKTKPECSDNAPSVWRKLNQDSIDFLSDKDWVCVRAASTAYGYQSLQVDFSKPTIDLKQEGEEVLFKFDINLMEKDPTIIERSHWGQVFNQYDCSNNNKNISWKQMEGDKIDDLNYGEYWVCVYMMNRFGIENYQTLKVNVKVPYTPPTLSIGAVQHSQDFYLTFSQKETSNKRYATSSTKQNCKDVTGYSAVPQDEILTNLTINDWVCVEGTFNENQYYLRKQVLTPPVLSTAQYATSPDNGVKRATLKVTFNPTSVYSRQYALTTGSSCDNVEWLALPSNLIFTENDKVCLRARDSKSVWGYLLHEYMAEPTYSTIRATSATVTWPTTVSTKQYFTSVAQPTDCDSSKTNGWTTASTATTDLFFGTNGSWICLNTTKTEGSSTLDAFFEYQHIHIGIGQHGDKIIAQSSPATATKHHFIATTANDPNCDGTDTGITWVATTNQYITATNNDDHICLRVVSGSKTVYREYQLKSLTDKGATIDVSTAGQIGIDWPTISSPESIKLRRYFTFHSDPSCSQATHQQFWTNVTADVDLTGQTNGHYVCTLTHIENTTDDYELFVYKEDRLAVGPTIAISSQDRYTLTLTFTPVVTGKNVTGKKWYTAQKGNANKPICSDSDPRTNWANVTSQNKIVLQNDTDAGLWICVKASEQDGFNGYKIIKFQKESPNPGLTQIARTHYFTSEGNTTTHKHYYFHASIGSGNDCNSSSSSTDEIVECKYFKASSNPDCSPTNTTATWVNFTAPGMIVQDSTKTKYHEKYETFGTAGANSGDYVCARIKNNRGFYSYAEKNTNKAAWANMHKHQSNNKIKVTLSGGSWTVGTPMYLKITDSGSPPICDHTVGSGYVNKGAYWLRSFTIASNKWACVKRQNSNGVVSYGVRQRDW